MVDTGSKHQLIIIDGGNAYDSDDQALEWLRACDWDLFSKMPSWKRWLSDGLSDTFRVIRPDMPNTLNAKYQEWKIWFEKYIPHLSEVGEKSRLFLVGHSLGGIFLAKYLSENIFPYPIHSLHLVAPVIDNDGLLDESVGTFGFDPSGLSSLPTHVTHIHLWHSEDDPIAPFSHSQRYMQYLGDEARLHTFHNRGHFIFQSHFIELFQEILTDLAT